MDPKVEQALLSMSAEGKMPIITDEAIAKFNRAVDKSILFSKIVRVASQPGLKPLFRAIRMETLRQKAAML